MAWTLITCLINLDANWFKGKTSELFDLWSKVLTSKRLYNEGNELGLRELNIKRYGLKGL